MKKLTKGLLAAGAMIAATSATAFVEDMCPIVGVDFQQAWMRDKTGDFNPINNNTGIAPKSYPGATLYVGSRLCEYLGVELGWDWSAKQKRDTNLSQLAPGVNIPVKTTVKRQGAHLDLLTYVPMADCFELMIGAGIGYVTAKTEFSTTNTAFANAAVNRGFFGTFKPKGTVGRIRLGGNYMINECIGLRALLGWESTSNLHVNYFNTANTAAKVYPFKDSMTAALGIFYKF